MQVIGSLIAQLCLQVGEFPSCIEEQCKKDSQPGSAPRRPEFSLLEEACSEISQSHQIKFVIDALDECESPTEILDFLFSTVEKSKNLFIMVTSRDEKDIRCRLKHLPRISLEAESQSVAKDILLYIKIRLETESELKWLNQQIRGEIEEQLSSSKNGSWMCVLSSISSFDRFVTDVHEQGSAGYNASSMNCPNSSRSSPSGEHLETFRKDLRPRMSESYSTFHMAILRSCSGRFCGCRSTYCLFHF